LTGTAIWDRSFLRGGIAATAIAKVCGLVLLFDWSGRALDPFDLTKSVYSRALEWVLVALLVAALVSFGPAIVPRTRLHLAIAALLIVNVLSTITAPVPYVAAFGTDGRYLGLVFIVDMCVLYLAVATAFRTSSDWAALFAATTVAVAISLGYAWVQFAGYDPLSWTGSLYTRPFSTIGNPNTYGHLLSVSLGPAALVAIAYAGPRRVFVRALAAALVVGIVGISAIVATRGTVLGLAAALVTVPLLILRARGVTRRSILATAAGGLAVVIGVGAILSVSPLGARVLTTFEGSLILDRLFTWEGSARAFLDRPILGWGPDSLIVAWPTFRPAELARIIGPGISVDSAHDWILHAAVTTGLLGLAALIAAIAAFGVSLLRALRSRGLVAAILTAGLAGYFAHALVSVGTIGVDWVPWVVFGGVASFAAAVPGPVSKRFPRPAFAVAAVTALCAVTGAGAVFGLRAFDANREALRAKHFSDNRQAPDALALASRAVALDGGRADYWNELGRAYGVSDRWRDAVDAFRQAELRAPYLATYPANEARAVAQLTLTGDPSRGSADAAVAAAQRAVTIDPNEPLTHVALAQIALALERPEIALEAAVDAIRLYPNPADPAYDGLAAAAAAKATDPVQARAELERALGYKETARLRVALASVELRLGDKTAALQNARRALVLDPRDAEAQSLVRAAGG